MRSPETSGSPGRLNLGSMIKLLAAGRAEQGKSLMKLEGEIFWAATNRQELRRLGI
jgi:hypothetical protein